jgi:hypothetical protein
MESIRWQSAVSLSINLTSGFEPLSSRLLPLLYWQMNLESRLDEANT